MALSVAVICAILAGVQLWAVVNHGIISYELGGWAPPWGIEYRIDALNALVALLISSIAVVSLFYALLPWEVDYWPYDATHVLTQLQLLFFSALAFVWLNKKGLYPPELRSINLDVEWIYRKFLPAGINRGLLFVRDTRESLMTAAIAPMHSIRHKFSQSSIAAKYHLSESWPTGSMVLWIAIILVSYLLLDSFVYSK